jgi:HK97 family phage major capsid protein
MDLKKLIEERAKNWERMKELNDLAEKEGRSFLGTEAEEYEKLEADLESFSADIDRKTRFEGRARAFEGSGSDGAGRAAVMTAPEEGRDEKREADLREFRAILRGDKRSLQADSDTEGGYLLAPQTVAAILLEGMQNETFMRQIAHVETITSAESLGVVSLDADLDDANWTQELTQTTVDEALRLGKRELKPNPLTKETKLSRTLVRKTTGRAEDLVLGRLAYKFGTTAENAYLNGSGAGQPLGVFTASSQGISTGRDVSTDATATNVTADHLIECKHTLKGQYWPRARWIFHRDCVKKVRKLKDGNDQYLWQPGIGTGSNLQGGIPNTILDTPYLMSEYAPNTFTASQYVGILGDFEYYWIVDALQLEIQVLNELYARTNQFGYIGRLESDGMPVLEEAFVRVKLAAS